MTNRPIAVIVAGLSGAGKSTVLHAFEDAGFRVFDALPLNALAESVGEILADGPAAFVVDHRSGDAPTAAAMIERIATAASVPVRRLFLGATDATLLRRYAESRRPHPYAATHPDIAEAIAAERADLAPLETAADAVIATDALEPRALAAAALALADGRPAALRPALHLVSFGFKHGAPADAEWLLDARALPNPHYDPTLRPRDGRDAAVAAYALDNPRGEAYLAAVRPLLHTLLELAAADGRPSVSVAVGCTGGQHRSVAIVEALAAAALRDGSAGNVRVHHRDVARR